MKIRDINTALRIFYEYPELGNKEIVELYGPMSTSTINKLKKPVRAKMAELDITTFKYFSVHTKTAYEIWGIDVKDLESRRDKLIKLGLYAAPRGKSG